MQVLNRLPSCLTAASLVAMFLTMDCNLLHADWPMSRGDASSTGATATPLPLPLELTWQYRLEGLGFDSGPIIAESTVYAADADGQIVALSLKDGSQIWKKKFEAGFMASPAWHEGVLYLGDLDGIIRALDPKTGDEKWSYNAEREIDAGANFFKDKVLMTSQSGSLIALDRQQGKLLWQYETEDQLQCGPTLAGNLTFLGGCDQHLHIIDVESGRPHIDKIPIQSPTGSTPTVAAGTVLVPNYQGQIWAFAIPGFDLLWKFENSQLAGEFKNSLAATQNIVVAASGNRRLFALDLKTGALLWENTLRRRVEGSPVIAGDQIVVAGSDGRVALYDLKTGQELWMYELKGSFLGSPAVAHHQIIVASDRGEITCFGKK